MKEITSAIILLFASYLLYQKSVSQQSVSQNAKAHANDKPEENQYITIDKIDTTNIEADYDFNKVIYRHDIDGQRITEVPHRYNNTVWLIIRGTWFYPHIERVN